MKSVSKTPTSGQTSHSSAVRPPLDDLLDVHGTAAREGEKEDASRMEAQEAGSSNGSGKAPPPDNARPIPIGPQFALRLGDGAMLMAIEGHAEDRDLARREVWTAFVLTAEEADLATKTLDDAGHAAASRIAAKLPKK